MTTNWVALSNRDLFSHSSGGQNSEITSVGLLLLEAVREMHFHASLLASGGCQPSLALPNLQIHHSRIYFHMIVSVSSLLLIKTPVVGFRVISRSLTHCFHKDSVFQIRSHSEIPGWTCIFGRHYSTHSGDSCVGQTNTNQSGHSRGQTGNWRAQTSAPGILRSGFQKTPEVRLCRENIWIFKCGQNIQNL